MPLLQVRDFPADLYEQLGQVAAVERRSITQEVIVLLAEALSTSDAAANRRRVALDRATELARSTPANELDPADLIRQDRDR